MTHWYEVQAMRFVCSENIEVGFSARDLWQTARQRKRDQKRVSMCVSCFGFNTSSSIRKQQLVSPLNIIIKGKWLKLCLTWINLNEYCLLSAVSSLYILLEVNIHLNLYGLKMCLHWRNCGYVAKLHTFCFLIIELYNMKVHSTPITDWTTFKNSNACILTNDLWLMIIKREERFQDKWKAHMNEISKNRKDQTFGAIRYT